LGELAERLIKRREVVIPIAINFKEVVKLSDATGATGSMTFFFSRFVPAPLSLDVAGE
jgi:hypothetical protein